MLAGFSGPGTFGIAQLLADQECETELGKLTNEIKDEFLKTEAIIETSYTSISDTSKGDNRKVIEENAVCFKGLDVIVN